jgi:hypothetical protein
LLGTTLVYAEKVGSQFLSLRQIGRRAVFSERFPWQLSPISKVISDLGSGLAASRIVLFFSERAISLRTSGLHKLNTVLEK